MTMIKGISRNEVELDIDKASLLGDLDKIISWPESPGGSTREILLFRYPQRRRMDVNLKVH